MVSLRWAAVAAILGTTGCSSGHPGAISFGTRAIAHNLPSIVSAIGAESRHGGLSYEVPVGDGGGCVVTKILSSQMEVSAALKAGDRVAANPAKTLGLTVHDAHESSCVTQLTQELKGLS
ncbi:MAG: hypothetical protein QOI76_1303 [Frankiales bacterium]|nr:hypothetical protein [Frankiales bacterium]